MALRVLKQQAEKPVQSGDRTFPKGTFRFTIQAPNNQRTRPTPDFMHNAASTPADKSPRIAGADGEILSVWLGEAESLKDGQADPGKQIFFQDFVVRDGDINIMDLDVDAPGNAGWQIQRDARLLANFAIALGATTETTQGDKTYTDVAENFVDMLKDGEFDGHTVVAEIAHRNWTSKTGKSGTEALIVGFTPDA